jgi:hypothetical protein
MSKLVQKILAAVMMTALVSAGAFAQGKGGDKRPPKPPAKVIEGKGSGSKPPRDQPKPPKEDRGKKRP